MQALSRGACRFLLTTLEMKLFVYVAMKPERAWIKAERLASIAESQRPSKNEGRIVMKLMGPLQASTDEDSEDGSQQSKRNATGVHGRGRPTNIDARREDTIEGVMLGGG